MLNRFKEFIQDKKFVLRHHKQDLKRHKKINRQILSLQPYPSKFGPSPKPPIIVGDSHQKPCCYADVYMIVPTWRGMKARFIFTLESKISTLAYKSFDDLQCDVWYHCNEKEALLLEPVEFPAWFMENAHRVLKTPIIEYDFIFTCEDELNDNDVLKYTKLWLEYWYPNLAKRDIILDQP